MYTMSVHSAQFNDSRHFLSQVFGTPSSSNNRDDDENNSDVEGKVKTRLLSMWNNVKYGMKLKTNFSKESPVWLLGRCYHKKLENTDLTEVATDVAAFQSQGNLTTNEDEGFEGFKADFTSKIWMTYRREFPILNGSTYSSDCGWGCMLRSGQMMLAQALICHILGRNSQTYLTNGRYYHKNTYLTEVAMDVVAFQNQGNLTMNEDEGFEGFKADFMSRIWMTYRREFPILNGSTYSSDCGWGCMLRSGQMMLAQALICHILGRSWRWNPDSEPLTREYVIENVNHRKIIKWFGDKKSRNSPFSIHELVRFGESSGKKAGDWYGPGFVAHLLRQAVKSAAQDNYEFDSITVYVAQDCAVYIKDVLEECTSEKDDKWKSLILLIPVRLGAEKFNQIYTPCLTALFSLEQCIGVIGGRPKHSLYFIGYQDDKLIHLDPHYCQEMVDVWASDFPLTSFHCRSPRKMHLSKMDPSCCIGFYCSTKTDFMDLKEKLTMLAIPPKTSHTNIEYPMFVFSDGYGRDARATPSHYQAQVDYHIDDLDSDYIETEEFEVL